MIKKITVRIPYKRGKDVSDMWVVHSYGTEHCEIVNKTDEYLDVAVCGELCRVKNMLETLCIMETTMKIVACFELLSVETPN